MPLYQDALSMSKQWNKIVDALTLKQLVKTMGGPMDYRSKACKVMTVTKSKRIHMLCNMLIATYDSLEPSVTYPVDYEGDNL